MPAALSASRKNRFDVSVIRSTATAEHIQAGHADS